VPSALRALVKKAKNRNFALERTILKIPKN
jgi:hypothetical protein